MLIKLKPRLGDIILILSILILSGFRPTAGAVEFFTFTQSLQRISSSTRTTLAIVRCAPTLAATVFTAKCPT